MGLLNLTKATPSSRERGASGGRRRGWLRGRSEVDRADEISDVDQLDEPDVDEALDEPASRPTWLRLASDTGTRATLVSWARGLFTVFLFSGPVALLVAVAAFSSAGTPVVPPVRGGEAGQASLVARTQVGSFAEDFVQSWLTTARGDEDKLGRFIAGASSMTLPREPWRASNPAATSVTRSTGGWSSTIAVTVQDPQTGVGERRYFQVAVRRDGSKLLAQTLPAPVAAPAPAESAGLDYQHRASANDPIGRSAAGFLTALTVGSSDVSRYTSPGSGIRAIDPAPYAQIDVEDILSDVELAGGAKPAEDGDVVHLLVSATATSPAKQSITVQYALTMRGRDGRWEVKNIDPTPQTRDVSSTQEQP